jgi:eukaryotic-like serine/threonine-protein kinase
VAAKLIREDVMERPGVAERFHVEARLAAGFSHPNVVTVHDFGLTRGRAFLIMELVDGITLREELQTQGRIPPRRVCHLLSGMCAAVEEAHHHRLVHRDLKPENVMLTGRVREVAKILDFGVAKLLQTDTTVSGHDTAGDVRVGTLRYMAPEQLRGENVQPAWDLWALGVLAFEMLTDSLPFSVPIGLTVPYETQWTVDVSRRATLRGVSGDWQEFFAHALALDPARRPQSASAFLNEFERAVG